MKKEQVEIVITSFLIIILLFAVFNALKGGKKRTPEAGSAEKGIAGQAQPGVHAVPTEVSFKDLASRVENIKWFRDPFTLKPAYLLGRAGELKLDGIVWDKQNPKAMIGGVIVGVGEKVGEYTIINITPQSVILTDGVTEIQLRI